MTDQKKGNMQQQLTVSQAPTLKKKSITQKNTNPAFLVLQFTNADYFITNKAIILFLQTDSLEHNQKLILYIHVTY